MLSAEVKAKLAENSTLVSGYDVLRGKMPASPNKVIVITESGGSAPEHFMGSNPIEEPTVQIRVRGEADDIDGPRLGIERIFQALIGYGAFTVSGVRYLGFTALQSPFPFRKDENQRYEWAVNFRVQKDLSSTA